MFRYVGGQLGVRGLRGDFEDRCHGLVLCPGGLLCQHLHHGAAQAPAKQTGKNTVRTHSVSVSESCPAPR